MAENLFLARQPRRFGLIDWARIRRESVALLQRVGLHVGPATPVRKLGIGQRQLVEIARALDLDARVLVLDEPTAALTGIETDQLLEIMADLRTHGVGLMFITHHLQQCRRIADRITGAARRSQRRCTACRCGRQADDRADGRSTHHRAVPVPSAATRPGAA